MGCRYSGLGIQPDNNMKQMYDFSTVRELRKREGLSIADVSGRSGISPAVISKLERNQVLPNVDTLYRIGRVFGLNASDLLSLAETRSAHRIAAAEHTNHGIHFREISYGNVRCQIGTAPAGTCTAKPQVHGDDFEVCWVLSGRLRFCLPHEQHELASGDAIQFDGILDHSYEALEDSSFILIHLTKEKRF